MPNGYIYTAREYGNMILCLGEAKGNASLALRLYKEKYPKARPPSDGRMITAAFQRVLENRPIVPAAVGGRTHDVIIEDRIIEEVKKNPHLGNRSLAKLVKRKNGSNVSHTLVHDVLRRNNINKTPIADKEHQQLADHDRRINYCRWLLKMQENDPSFIQHVIWTDEAIFTKNGMFNGKNPHVFKSNSLHTDENAQWSINVWAGIYNDQILGPVFLPHPLDGQRYLDFINKDLVEILDELSLLEYHRTWFQHDGAPSHVARPVRERLTELFNKRWIGRLGPQEWPPRSPDLTPLNFLLWGYVKDSVFKQEYNTEEEMRETIVEVFEKLRKDCVDDPTLMTRLHAETERRAQVCIQLDGGQLEPHLIKPKKK